MKQNCVDVRNLSRKVEQNNRNVYNEKHDEKRNKKCGQKRAVKHDQKTNKKDSKNLAKTSRRVGEKLSCMQMVPNLTSPCYTCNCINCIDILVTTIMNILIVIVIVCKLLMYRLHAKYSFTHKLIN